MNVYIAGIDKNHRSTYVPILTGDPISCQLKTPCSNLKPVLEFSVSPANHASFMNSFNYVYIPDFNRYYYVSNVVSNGQLVNAYCEVDVLASWKTAITGSSQYVLRSASAYSTDIKDSKYPVKAVTPDRSGTYGTQVENPLQPGAASYGCFVVGIVSKGGSLSGCVSYYAMSYLVMIDLMLKLFNLQTQWGNGGQDLADGLKKAITDPMQYVVSCMWFPYSVNDFYNRGFASAVSSVTVGYDTITLGASAYGFDNVLNIEFTNLVTFTIPHHPQAATRGYYLDFEPYSRYFFSFYPFCTLCELDSSIVGGKGSIYALYTVDLRSGKGVMNVCTEINGTTYADWKPKSPVRCFEAQVGVPVPVSTIHTELQNLSQYTTSIVAAAGTEFQSPKGLWNKLVASGAKLWGDILNLDQGSMEAVYNDIGTTPMSMGDIGNIASNAAAMKSACEMFGSQGTMSTYSRQIAAAWGNFYYVADNYDARFGRPLCKQKTLSTLSGFCQCENPRIQATGMMLPEELEIENKLTQGVYLE